MTAYVPLLDEEFVTKVDMKKRNPDPEFLKRDYEAEMKRFRELKSKATEAEGESAEELVQCVEESPLMKEVEDTLAAAKGDPDAAAKCEKRLLELKLKLDEAADSLEWPVLVADARRELDDLNSIVNRSGSQSQRDKAAELTDEVEDIIAERKMDRLRKKIEQVLRLYWEIVFAQPGFWVHQLQLLEKKQQQMSDATRSTRLLDQGRDCIAKNNITGLQSIVRQLWDLLPNEVVEAAQRGFQSGLVK